MGDLHKDWCKGWFWPPMLYLACFGTTRTEDFQRESNLAMYPPAKFIFELFRSSPGRNCRYRDLRGVGQSVH